MNYLTELRQLFSISQEEMAEFVGFSRSHYSMIERNHRSRQTFKLYGLDQLAKFYYLAKTAPDLSIVEEIKQSINQSLVSELIGHLYKLEDAITIEKAILAELEIKHEHTVLALTTLKMMKKEILEESSFKQSQKEWVEIQIRETQKRLIQYSAFKIQSKRIHIIGLYTQLDQIKLVLQSE